MIEILAVDDEPLVLLAVKALVDWEAEGMRIAGTCENGKAALAWLRNRPETDVVITDVDMPVMDGLTLAESLRVSGNGIATVFLSSYRNFEYARRAFKTGAADYILKTELDGPRLVSLIRRALAERGPRLAGSAAGERFKAGPGCSEPDGSPGGLVPGPTAGQPLEPDQTRTPGPDAFALTSVARSRGAMFARLSENCLPGSDELEACSFAVAAPFRFLAIRPGDMPLVRRRYEGSLYDFQRTVSDLLGHFISHPEGDSGAASFDLYYAIMRDEERLELAFEAFYEAAWSYLDIGFERRLGDPVETLAEFPASFARCSSEFQAPSRIVVRTRRYIREHFAEPSLNLLEIAEYSEVSKNHLSWEFTRETGENVTDFIARTRIHTAKKLLLETNLKTYEIAERTGYANVETFTRAFRRVTGTSPRRYS